MRVAIVGGGIAGLAAAWELRHEAEITLFEPDRFGGRIRTSRFEGHLVDEGADAFLTRVPEALQLCHEVGIEHELVAPSAGRSMLWWNGRLRPLPDGLVLGVPRQLTPLIRSGLLSPRGMARAALDLVLPRGRPASALTVRDLVAHRFGAQVADRLVDPLLGGIHAGWTGDLGAAEVAPQLVTAAEESRSLLVGLRRLPTPADQPMFMAPRRGVGRLVDALVQSLREAGVRFVCEAVEAIRSTSGGRVLVVPESDPFDAAVVATPGRAAAEILGPDGTGPLTKVPTASVALVTAALSGADLPPGINGFLVPRGEGRLMTACSFASNKWPHWSDPDRAVVRMSAGRWGDETPLHLDDAVLVDKLLQELGEALGSTVGPVATRVSRFPEAFPQYLPGHQAGVSGVEAALRRRLPAIALAGAAYRGPGIPACIASGRRAARMAVGGAGAPGD